MATKKVAQQEVGIVEKSKKFLRGVWSELKKVHWPDKKQLATYTGVVFVAVSLVAVMIWIIDSGLGFLLSFIY